MLVNSAKTLVHNLSNSKPELDSIREDLESLTDIASSIQEILNNVLDHMNEIIDFDLNELQYNSKSAEEIQGLADKIQRNLFEARLELNGLEEESITDYYKTHPLYNSLIDIYKKQIEKFHQSFTRLDQPEVALLMISNVNKSQLESYQKKLILDSLHYFINSPNNIPSIAVHENDELYKTVAEIFTPLSEDEELTGAAYMIYNDCNEISSVPISYDPEQHPYLEGFMGFINETLKTNTNDQMIMNAISNNRDYNLLIAKLFDSAYKASNLKLSEFTKIILSLQYLKNKCQQTVVQN